MQKYSKKEIEQEARRLTKKINQPDLWPYEMCHLIAPLTLNINRLKQETNTIILAHSYQTPDILYGVADEVGDSYTLSLKAKETSHEQILFSSVRFMAETAKVVNPHKTVLHPRPESGCSLADSITAEDVRKLKARHPEIPVLCYINTTAEVKAECDICVTSSNYIEIAQQLTSKQIIFLPDRLMGQNLQTALPDKQIITYDGTCVVHEEFTVEQVQAWKEQEPTLQVLVHPECHPEVAQIADYVGSSKALHLKAQEIHQTTQQPVMMVTECGSVERLRSEVPGINLKGNCNICPYMKMTNLEHIYRALSEPTPEQIIELDEPIQKKALQTLDKMFKATQ